MGLEEALGSVGLFKPLAIKTVKKCNYLPWGLLPAVSNMLTIWAQNPAQKLLVQTLIVILACMALSTGNFLYLLIVSSAYGGIGTIKLQDYVSFNGSTTYIGDNFVGGEIVLEISTC